MKYRNNIKLLYLIIFFHNLIPAYVIERLFWQERGMNVREVVYCEIIYAAVVILLEIPSGVFADKLGRKKIIILGVFLDCFEFSLLILANSFWVFALVTFIAGISKACTSGAWNALLYDSLAACGKASDFERVIGRVKAVDFTSAMIAALSGSILAERFGFVTNYKISAVSVVLAFIFSLWLKEPPTAFIDTEVQAGVKDILSAAVSFFKKNVNVLVIVIQSMFISACLIYADEFWQLYLDKISFPVVFFGIASACMLSVRIPGALISAKLLRYMKPKTIVAMFSALASGSLVFTGVVKNAYGMAGFALLAFSMGVIEPVVSGYIHHRVDSAARATIESVTSLTERVLVIAVGLCFAYVTDRVSIFNAYAMIGGFCAITTIIYIFAQKETRAV